MAWERSDVARGLESLRVAVASALAPRLVPSLAPQLLSATADGGRHDARPGILFAEAVADGDHAATGGPEGYGDADLATSSEDSEEERTRLIALVELARKGDAEAFGLLYDHYQGAVYRFLFYRTRSQTLAEDLASETFFRALRSMTNFRWQGKDFGAWLMTIARNLATDHFKAGRTRLEMTTEDMGQHDERTEGPESLVLASLTNEMLLEALTELPDEQRDCLVMRFLQGMSIAETAAVLGRSDGAVKQLQLRGVRNLAKLMPEGIRG
jgi:RNA polymerase sigma-70 factor (ECF subfamily)